MTPFFFGIHRDFVGAHPRGLSGLYIKTLDFHGLFLVEPMPTIARRSSRCLFQLFHTSTFLPVNDFCSRLYFLFFFFSYSLFQLILSHCTSDQQNGRPFNLPHLPKRVITNELVSRDTTTLVKKKKPVASSTCHDPENSIIESEESDDDAATLVAGIHCVSSPFVKKLEHYKSFTKETNVENLLVCSPSLPPSKPIFF